MKPQTHNISTMPLVANKGALIVAIDIVEIDHGVSSSRKQRFIQRYLQAIDLALSKCNWSSANSTCSIPITYLVVVSSSDQDNRRAHPSKANLPESMP